MKKERNVAFVGVSSLCASCGACEGVCPNDAVKLVPDDDKGIYKPDVNDQKCIGCGLCMKVCPGFKIDLKSRPAKNKSDYIGCFSDIYRARSADKGIANQAASGGLATVFIKHLFDKGEIDGAIVTVMDNEDPLKTKTYIAENVESLLKAQGSKYIPTPVNRILKSIINGKVNLHRLAYIGLPCHVEALRLAQENIPILKDKIKYVFSLFCSRTPTMHATEFLLDSVDIDKKELAKINYRASTGHPGKLVFETRAGKNVSVPHLDWRYWGHAFSEFFMPARCFLCFDKTAELADVSFGDNWKKMGGSALGASSIIIRSDSCSEMFGEIQRNNLLEDVSAMTEEELVRDQDLVWKRSMGCRYMLMEKMGKSVPVHNVKFSVLRKHLVRTRRLLNNVIMGEKRKDFSTLRLYIYASYVRKTLRNLPARIKSRIKRMFRNSLGLLVVQKRASVKTEVKKKVVIIGGFGWRDIGDEAMPHADIIQFRKFMPAVDIVMVSPDSAYTTEFHGERSIDDVKAIEWPSKTTLITFARMKILSFLFLTGAFFERFGLRMRLWPEARIFLDELAEADVLFNVGGGNLNSVIRSELFKKCTMYLAASIMRKPVLLSGQTIGPFSRWSDKCYARYCLNKVDFISFRDKDVSLKRLKEIGVTRPDMKDAADDAISLPLCSKERAQDLLSESVPDSWLKRSSGLKIAMNMKGSLRLFKDESSGSSLDNEINLMAGIADKLVEEFDARIYWVPTDYCSAVDDRILHREIISRMNHEEKAVSVEKEYNDLDLKALLSLADIVIGARYHFCVFAASELVPFVGIASGLYQQTKLKGLADLCNCSDCFVSDDLGQAKLDVVWLQIEKNVRRREELRAVLREIVPVLKEESIAGIKVSLKLMGLENKND